MTAKKQNRWRRLLRRAANILRTKGWVRSTKAAHDGSSCHPLDPNANQFCLIGSLIRANKEMPGGYYGGDGAKNEDRAEHRTYFQALDHLATHPKIRKHAEYGSLGFWQFNDREAKSAEDVIQVLLETANG